LARGVAHWPQNLFSGGLVAPQDWQIAASGSAHWPQNLMPTGFSAWHRGHCNVRSPGGLSRWRSERLAEPSVGPLVGQARPAVGERSRSVVHRAPPCTALKVGEGGPSAGRGTQPCVRVIWPARSPRIASGRNSPDCRIHWAHDYTFPTCASAALDRPPASRGCISRDKA
jgi:hypothetical protein